MLIRLDNPRLVINAQEFPQHVILMAVRYGEAQGDVTVNFLDGGRRHSEIIHPTRALDVLEGMTVHEFVLPFWDLHDGLGRRGATGGFHVVGTSAFRAQGGTYGVRTLDFTMQFPVIGGGILRINVGGQEWDLANPTFDPRAPLPAVNRNYGAGRGNEYESGPAGINNQRVPDDVLINAYQRTHRGYVGRGAEIERRRQERLANFDLQEAREADPPSVLDGAMRMDPDVQQPAPVIVDPVEARRQERLAQIRRSSEEQSPGIVVAPARAPKAPPRTRLERTSDDD